MSPHLPAAYNLARWLTRSATDAEDVVQEAFLRAFSGFAGFRGDNAKPWLLAIVRNTAFSWMKKNGPPGNATVIGPLADGSHADQARADELRDESPHPEEALLISRERERVHKALHQLPEPFREALVLRELEGCSYQEIASIAGVPTGTVMSRLSRGREALKELLLNQEKEAV